MPVRRSRSSVATAVAAVVVALAALVVAAPPASASAVEACSLDLSSGAYSCTSVTGAARAVEASTTTLIARMYDAPNRSAADGYLDVFAAGPCDLLPDVDWQVGVMPTGWNDRISSFQAFSGCQARLFQNGGFSGVFYGPAAVANSLGAMDNQTSSMTFS